MLLNGLDFHVEVVGDGAPLLLLHGFTGSLRTWDFLRPALASSVRLIAVDLIGHGRSPSPPASERYSLDWSARDLAALMDALGLQAADLLGYSMGGRMALHFACRFPKRVRRLILESAAPGIENDGARMHRIASDDALAERILRDGIERFVEEWERQPLLALAPHVADDVRARQHAQRLGNSPTGLANSLRGMGAGQQMPVWSHLAVLDMPVQLIVGSNDRRYCVIAERMHSALPHAKLDVVVDAGHTVHLDQPRHFTQLVRKCVDNKLTPADARCYIDPERLF
jgi:2-succinyl-6-hydroxy-2,4-cyclohexadiene-1-carboxylate synthase